MRWQAMSTVVDILCRRDVLESWSMGVPRYVIFERWEAEVGRGGFIRRIGVGVQWQVCIRRSFGGEMGALGGVG